MKVGILADIHGNHDALQVVLNAARRESVNCLLIAGDIVGYYYDAKRVIESLTEFNWTAIAGNHEQMLAMLNDEVTRIKIKKKYGSGLEISKQSLPEKWLYYLFSLPRSVRLDIVGVHVLMCHGSPWDTNEYIYPDADEATKKRLFEFDKKIGLLIYGHTHYPVVWLKRNRYIINPGSVGQTRDRIPGACWALWETDNHTVQLKREIYDPTELIQKCKYHDPKNSYLTQVLVRT